MAVWDQLDVNQAHKTYAVLGIFTTLFCLVSLLMKERLFVGEAFISTVTGVIVGPHAANIMNPLEWSDNPDFLTLEISRIILIVQLFAVSVELPQRYIKKHLVSLIVLLCFTMILGWVITGLFTWIIFPEFNFIDGLAITAAITATDPVLAAAIVGKGKFSERIPAYIRDLLSAESGANDGLAFPFVLLAVDILTKKGHPGIIIRDWFCIAILYECVFGVLLGTVIGYLGKKAIQFCEARNMVDKQSLLVFYITLSLICTGLGSILGVDDLLVAFAAGAAFAWDGWFVKQSEGQQLSNSIDLLLNVGYFLYFGTIIPWEDFNNKEIGLHWWRLVLLGIAIIFLRRIPAALAAKPFVPDIKSWKEALFVGHFGPVGVGGIFCSIVTKSAIEGHFTKEETPIDEIDESMPHYWVLRCIWPIVSFIVIVSILVHGFSVTAIVFYSKMKKGDVSSKTLDTNATTLEAKQQQDMESIKLNEFREATSDEGIGSSNLHLRRNSTKAGKLLGKNYTKRKDELKMETLKFFKIGRDILVEDSKDTIVKKYRLNDEDPESNDLDLNLTFENDNNGIYDDDEVKKMIRGLFPKK
ncbi:Na(+)/H(+) antiporter [Wickerhamomyces ciferrii]|uniref:Na(+)/H(+) antiporter n=1 Tax=Wickerhamomyces ciferrii (strain ATCC 14091 / BCRC 22168 / CBS 111 / JCM 3599 / NBRC 0793 / NRRL Y-1031 F-60-10) TaxID=1206466 RepID=K0KJE9_WICCF|nr:Na(+)/H(+) antiporter [Wickerhamomyces ciferrii]CCH43101.1 Na(+)/H(+) antiporter [Wickerhamomyces ciferrii]